MPINRRRIELAHFTQAVFDKVSRSTCVAARRCVNKTDSVVVLGKRIGQVIASNTEVNYSHVVRQSVGGQLANHFAAKAVVAEENIADSGYEDAFHCAPSSNG